GLARREPAPTSGRAITPGGAVGRAVRLLPPTPELGRETITDRPFGKDASCLAPFAARSMSFLYWPRQPFFPALDPDGVQVGVLSDDPNGQELPRDVPRLPDEAAATKLFNVFGTGRGVVPHVGPEFGDPARWKDLSGKDAWDDLNQGRHFVGPAASSDRIRPH